MTRNEFRPEDIREFEPEAKIGLIATLNADRLPHITLITSIQAKSSRELIWGQFSEGMSKTNVKKYPETAFLILNQKKEMWRGKALWTRQEKSGAEFDLYNQKPMFRYNAYLGIHTVHYMNLIETGGKELLPLPGIAAGALLTKALKYKARTREQERILKPWAEGLFNRFDALKFLSYLDDEGYPVLVPVIQCQAANSSRLVFAHTAFKTELNRVRAGQIIALFGLTLQMENVLIRGTFRGFFKKFGLRFGMIDINWVYNSMPPIAGQIYPPIALKPVTNFN